MAKVRYFIYGSSDCPYCLESCEILQEQGLEFVFFDEPEREEIDLFKEFYNRETIPVILSNDIHSGETVLIGGCSDLKEVLNKND